MHHDQYRWIEIKFGDKLVGFFYDKTPFNLQSVDNCVWLRSSVIHLLNQHDIPTLNHVLTHQALKSKAALEQLTFPVKLKSAIRYTQPQYLRENISSLLELKEALPDLFKHHTIIIAEPYRPSFIYYRALVFYQKLIALVQLKPPHVVGDGHSSIEHLIRSHNQYVEVPENKVQCMSLTDTKQYEIYLQLQSLSFKSIPKGKQTIELSEHYLPEYGAIPVSHHCSNLSKAQQEKISKAVHLLGAKFAAVDFILDKQAQHETMRIIDILPDPSIGIFEQPFQGEPVAVARMLIQKLIKNKGFV